jgi:TPR repeat protein
LILIWGVVVGIAIYIIWKFTNSSNKKMPTADSNNDQYTNFRLGEQYNTGKTRNPKKAFELYNLASIQGHKVAMCRLAEMYCLGEAVPLDYDKAFDIYFSLCNKNKSEVPQQNILAFFQYFIEHKLPLNEVKYFLDILTKRAKRGSLFSQFLLGEMYFTGNKVEKNIDQSIYWYSLAANNSEDLDCGTNTYNLKNEAQYILADYYKNLDLTEESCQKSAYWYVEALNSYHMAAYNLLLSLTSTQDDIFFDSKEHQIKFLEYLYKTLLTNAEKKLIESQKMLSNMYSHGIYLEQDYMKSLYWLEKAAEQGSQEANYLVGTRYEDGCGTEKDIRKAIFWYRRAPNYGPALSRLNELTKYQS